MVDPAAIMNPIWTQYEHIMNTSWTHHEPIMNQLVINDPNAFSKNCCSPNPQILVIYYSHIVFIGT